MVKPTPIGGHGRVGAIREAWEAALETPREMGTPAEAFARLQPGEHYAPGTAAKIMRSLPLPERQAVMTAAEAILDLDDIGPRADAGKAAILVGLEASEEFEQFVDQMQIDDTAHRLMERRGTDASLPLPEFTRRDALSAAFDAHTTED